MSELLSTKQAAEKMGYHHSYINRLARNGRLKGAIKVGNQHVIPQDTVDAFKPNPNGRPRV